MLARLLLFAALALIASPAFAQASLAIPEPGDLGLFALAVVGLIVGRQVSRRPPPRPGADDEG